MISKCKRNLIITTPLNKPANQIICGFSKPIVFWFVGLFAARKSYPLISKYQLFTISMAPTNKPANQIIFCFSEAIFFCLWVYWAPGNHTLKFQSISFFVMSWRQQTQQQQQQQQHQEQQEQQHGSIY